MRKPVVSILTWAAALGLCSAGALAQSPAYKDFTKSADQLKSVFAAIVANAADSVVQVKCNSHSIILGTVIDSNGFIVTKSSELSGDLSVRLRDGREFPARIVDTRKELDIACLKIDATGLKAVTLADPKITVGEWVAAPGMPDQEVLNVGVVSTPRRNIIGKPGLLGVQLAESAVSAGDVDPPKGVKIDQIVPNSAASAAGLKANDLILKVNGKAPVDRTDLSEIIHSYEPNTVIELTISRAGEQIELKATLGENMAEDPSETQVEKRLKGDLSLRATNFPAVIQHDTVLLSNQCGGPLVDMDGKVLGINIARAGRTESYAIPADLIRPILLKVTAAASASTQPATQPKAISKPAINP